MLGGEDMAIHNCRQCGAIIPYPNAPCPQCSRKREEERRAREAQQKSNSGSKSNSSSSRSYTSYGRGGGGSIPTSIIITGFIAVIAIVAGIFIFNSFNSYYHGEWTYATADKQSSRSSNDYQNYLLSLDDRYPTWYVTYEKAPTDIWNYLLGYVKMNQICSYTIGGYHSESGDILEYRFEGDDAGTKLPDGIYTLTVLDETNVLIDENNEIIYKEGSSFYNTYVPKLRKLTHDHLLNTVLKRTKDGEHALYGSNDSWMEYIRKDNSMVYSYLLTDDVLQISGGEFRAITTYPKEQQEERWYFNYRDDEYHLDELAGYTYADQLLFQDSELDKLMKGSFDDSGSIEFYKKDELVMGIDVDYLANGYQFEVAKAIKGYDRGLEEDAVYRINTTNQSLAKVLNEGYSDETLVDMPLSKYQKQYDFLMSVIPHSYIQRIIDMDKAEKRKESIGLVTVYEMKDKNDKVSADMRLLFGKIGEVNHYLTEDEYVKIELEY